MIQFGPVNHHLNLEVGSNIKGTTFVGQYLMVTLFWSEVKEDPF